MGFHCPACKNKSLKINEWIELPVDARSDEITLQVISCGICNFNGLAVYEESRRGSLDSEMIDHYGYTLDRRELKEIKSLIIRCPESANPHCVCESHKMLNQRDAYGRWIRPGLENETFIFRMDL